MHGFKRVSGFRVGLGCLGLLWGGAGRRFSAGILGRRVQADKAWFGRTGTGPRVGNLKAAFAGLGRSFLSFGSRIAESLKLSEPVEGERSEEGGRTRRPRDLARVVCNAILGRCRCFLR